jgi:transposase InsO family protein
MIPARGCSGDFREGAGARPCPSGLGEERGVRAITRLKSHQARRVLVELKPTPINGLYKAELIHRRAPWKSSESVELATLQWVLWFNHTRLLEPIG